MKQSGTCAPASPRGSVYIPDDRSSDQRLPYFRSPTNPFVDRREALLQTDSGRQKHPLEFSKSGAVIASDDRVTDCLREPGDGADCRARSRDEANQLLRVPEIPFFEPVRA
ncbi:hypothetical protein [Sorangium sp. So ce693]|uniref:hypothetical protein n=1 Tax=Sorangium sp. So ce693 TaxID=3133318 RepID=UPI003F62F1E9